MSHIFYKKDVTKIEDDQSVADYFADVEKEKKNLKDCY